MNRPALKPFSLGIKTNKGIRPHTGFVVPDDVVYNREGIWAGSRSAGRQPFFHLARLWIQPADTAARAVAIPDHAVAGEAQPANPGAGIRNFVILDTQRVRIDRAEF